MRRLVIGMLIFLVILAAGLASATYWFFSGDGVRLALEKQTAAWLEQPVHVGAAEAQIFPRVGVRLRDVRVGEPARLNLAEVQVSTGLRALLSRRVEHAEVTVADSRIELPLPFVIPSDSAAGDTAGTKAFTVASIRTIALRNVQIVSRGRDITVGAQSSLAGSRLTVTSFTAVANATSIQASGVIVLEPAIDAQLKASAK